MELTPLQKTILRILGREQKPLYELSDILHHPGVNEACESLILNGLLVKIDEHGVVALPEKEKASTTSSN